MGVMKQEFLPGFSSGHHMKQHKKDQNEAVHFY